MRKLWIRYVACFILLAVLLLVLLVWNICAGSVDFTAEELLAALRTLELHFSEENAGGA